MARVPRAGCPNERNISHVGHHHDGKIGMTWLAPDVSAKDVPVHVGHYQVDHGHVETLLFQETKRHGAGGTSHHIDPRPSKMKAQNLEKVLVVVHSQDSHRKLPPSAVSLGCL